MYILEDTLAMLGAVFVVTSASMFAYNEDDTPIELEVITTVEENSSWYDLAQKNTECLATNIYFEARGESYEGKKAVAFVTLNRVESPNFPDTICDVVYQARHSRWWKTERDRLVPIKHQCQFSWYCDGKSDYIRNIHEYEELYKLASEIIVGKHSDNTGGADYYHSTKVKPDWRLAFTRTTKIDKHIFYAE
jgi:spore germination cell wall hydrolase CwlJ-like protein